MQLKVAIKRMRRWTYSSNNSNCKLKKVTVLMKLNELQKTKISHEKLFFFEVQMATSKKNVKHPKLTKYIKILTYIYTKLFIKI